VDPCFSTSLCFSCLPTLIHSQVAPQRRASPVPFPFPDNTNNSGDVPPLPHAGDDGEIPPFVDADDDHEIPPLEHTDDRDNGDTPLLVSESH
jgi:hypothetical protein